MRALICLVLLCFYSSIKAQIFWERKFIDSLITLQPELRNYATKTPCEKVAFLDSIGHKCKEDICIGKQGLIVIKEFELITKHRARLSEKHMHFLVYYNKPEDFYSDIVDWEKS